MKKLVATTALLSVIALACGGSDEEGNEVEVSVEDGKVSVEAGGPAGQGSVSVQSKDGQLQVQTEGSGADGKGSTSVTVGDDGVSVQGSGTAGGRSGSTSTTTSPKGAKAGPRRGH